MLRIFIPFSALLETSWDSILHNLVWKIHRVAATLVDSGKVAMEKFHVRKRFFFLLFFTWIFKFNFSFFMRMKSIEMNVKLLELIVKNMRY